MQNAEYFKQKAAEGKLNEVIEELFAIIEIAKKMSQPQAENFYDRLIMTKGELVEIEHDKQDGIISAQEYREIRQKLRKRITDFINSFPKQYFILKESGVTKAKASYRELIMLDDKRQKFSYDIFISFSHENENEVRELANYLRGHGLRIFIYFESIAKNAGGEFFDKIGNALKESRHLVLLSTPEAMQSKNVKMEYQNFHLYYHQKEPKNRKFIIYEGTNFKEEIIPVLFRNTDRVNNFEDLVIGLIDIDYLNKKYEEKQKKRQEKIEEELNSLRKKIQEYENKLKDKETEKKISFRFIDEAKQEGYNKAVAEKKEEIDNLKNKIEQLEEQINLLKKQLEDTNFAEKNDDLNSEIIVLHEKLQKLEQKNKQLEEEKLLLGKKIENADKLETEKYVLLQKDLKNLKEKLKKTENDKNNALNELKIKFEQLQKQKLEIEKLEKVNKEIGKQNLGKVEQKEYDNLKQEKIKIEKELTKYKKTKGKTNKNILSLVLSLVIVVLIGYIILENSGNKKDEIWQDVKTKNTLATFEKYINNKPDEKYLNEAIDSIFAKTLRLNDIKKIEEIIKKYPNNKLIKKAENTVNMYYTEMYNNDATEFFKAKNLIENNYDYKNAIPILKKIMADIELLKEKDNFKVKAKDLKTQILSFLDNKIQANENDINFDSDNKDIYINRIKLLKQLKQ